MREEPHHPPAKARLGRALQADAERDMRVALVRAGKDRKRDNRPPRGRRRDLRRHAAKQAWRFFPAEMVENAATAPTHE